MKHAYLILANRNPNQLQKLISMLDDKRNDIFLLIDKKSVNFPRKFNVKESNLFFVDPINVYWANFSQVEAEIKLFEAAHNNYKYGYYHLLSGLDLPLATQDEIHSFFDSHPNKEFINYFEVLDLNMIQILKIKIKNFFDSGSNSKFLNKNKVRRVLENRIKVHFFKNYQKNNSLPVRLYQSLERNLLLFFPQFKLDRKKIDIASQWVSIDDDLVSLIISEKDRIKKIFSKGMLSDEIFIPVIINLHPEYKSKIYYSSTTHYEKNKLQGNLRYINWWDVPEDSGSPYVWRKSNYDDLLRAKKNGHFFARKFDENIDNDIIDKIYLKVMKEEKSNETRLSNNSK